MHCVLVGCTNSKRDGTHLARDIYDESSVFRKRRAVTQRDGDCWGILSAKYGFLRPHDWIPNYDTHISERSPVWGAFVLEDLLPFLSHHAVGTVSIYAGQRYINPIQAALEERGYDIAIPNKGLRPGERRAALKEELMAGDQATLDELL